MKFNLICEIIGHKINPNHYGRLTKPYFDNIGRGHSDVMYECERCEEKIKLCRVHSIIKEK